MNDGPCGRWKPGDVDLRSFDLIREFHLDQLESSLQTVSMIEGTNYLQTAYKLQRETNLTMRAMDAFPKGLPHQFSFECTYRMDEIPEEPWHLLQVTNSYEESQLMISLNVESEILEVGLPTVEGDLQIVQYHHSILFDQRWHKIMLGVTNEFVNLWVDCKPVHDVEGRLNSPLGSRGRFDIDNGFFSIARLSESPITVPETPLIDLQWMVINCDPMRPARGNCDELPVRS